MSQNRGASDVRAGLGHIETLDGVRGIAILMVLLYHLRWCYQGSFLPDRLLAKAVDQGWTGVDLFFVLSGFLITGILLDTRDATNYFSSFYARRLLRVFPVYYWSLIFLFVLVPVLMVAPALVVPRYWQFWFWSYLSNWPVWFDPKVAPAVSHFWSLAVEEQFYIVWPLAVWLIPRKRLGWTLGGVIVIAVALRWILPSYGFDATWIYRNTLTRMDALALGSCGAMMFRSAPVRAFLGNRTGLLLAGGVAGFASARALGALTGSSASDGVWMQRLGYSLLGAGSLCVVLFAAVHPRDAGRLSRAARRVLDSRFLRLFGRYSYGMYVYHVPLLTGIRYFAADQLRAAAERFGGFAVALALMAICFVVAMVSYEAAERPILALKHHFRARYQVSTHELKPKGAAAVATASLSQPG